MLGHVVRRGLEYPSATAMIKRAVSEGKVEIPPWGAFLLVVSVVLIGLFLGAVDYSLNQVVATLTMVENPTASITVSSSEELAPKNAKEPQLEAGHAITVVHQKPITSKIRSTLRHLVEQTGTGWSRVRGILCFILYRVCFLITINLFATMTPRFPGHLLLISGITGALLANLHASWTHKVIAMPTDKWFHKRMPARSYWKNLALPAAVSAAMPYLSIYIAQGLVVIFGLDNLDKENFEQYTGAKVASLLGRFVTVIVIAIACTIFLCLPAMVTQIRVEASILPEDQDTIVPFDRTFAGKVVPRILGGTGAIGFLESWRSFDWEARRRLIKLYVKIFFVTTALVVVFFHVIAFEAWAIMGPALNRAMQQARQAQN